MVKSKEEVIAQFNENVNMTVEELEEWLADPKSKKAGTGVGLESGRKIIEILKKNPGRDPEGYDEEDIEHMRKVVGYSNRHLAQEEHLKDTKTKEELEKTKSTISLKNWGHDPIKTLGEETEKDTETDIASSAETINQGETKEDTDANVDVGSKRKREEIEEQVEESGEDQDSDASEEEEERSTDDTGRQAKARKKAKTADADGDQQD